MNTVGAVAAEPIGCIQLDIPVLLPNLPNEADACITRLVGDLTDRHGVEHVHILPISEDQPAKLCIHYQPNILSLGRIKEIAQSAGARVTESFGHVLWKTGGLSNERRARTVTEYLQLQIGVLEASVTVTGLVRIEFDRALTSETALRTVLSDLGVEVLAHPIEAIPEAAPHRDIHKDTYAQLVVDHAELTFSIACGVFLALAFLSTLAETPVWISLVFFVAAYGFGSFFLLREAIDTLRIGRVEIDVLMLVAAGGAAVLDKWAEGALLLFLFSMGHALEHFAVGRTRRAISALADLAPRMAEVRREGALTKVGVTELVLGDIVVIRPNTSIPADGFVVLGASSVDQSAITGESLPKDKQAVSDVARAAAKPETLPANNQIYAGTVNGSGVLEAQVTKLAANSSLARMVRLVQEAETQKSPTQRFTDRFENVFVPIVLVTVTALLFSSFVIDEPMADSFYRAMAVLVAASPCALAISTPSAVLSGVARAALGGVLVKGGGPLESLGNISAIAFDKTGTLTEGKPRLTDVVPAASISEQDLLEAVVAVETLSDHPLAAAVVRDGRLKLSKPISVLVEDLHSITGMGIVAKLDGVPVAIGKMNLFTEIDGPSLPVSLRSITEQLEADGRTTMIVRRGQHYLGVLGLMDTPRAAASPVIARLRLMGVSNLVMMSGDNQRVAEEVARQVGLDKALGDLMPEDKVTAIQQLRATYKVAMVGDGVNDAPAMANATVGIAMGGAGSDVALETADVVLMGDELSRLPFVIGLGRKTSRIIKQNLWISLGMVAVLVPATLLGLKLGVAVIFHEGSTLLVVMNALRLLAYRDVKS